jgi:hypothetical protein
MLVLVELNHYSSWIRHNIVTIFQIMCGSFWSHIFLVGKVLGEARRKITGNSSTPYSGFYVQERPGAIYRRRMVTGRICIGVFVVGETGDLGVTAGVPDG